ncbi:apolipoprotein N-acyltransferase [Pelagibacterales bacterium SAG-MED31]|nr:apolipoprotein N-acyltransferase [Pelagibacterales bacterium SAG-MED31]
MILLKFFILGVLSALVFPPFFMLPLGFIIFPYIIILLSKIHINKNFLYYFSIGFFYGLGFLFVFLSWVINPFLINQQTENFAIIGIVLPIFLSLFFGLGFYAYKYITKVYYLLIFTPFIFLFIEFFISNTFYGFPWVTYSLVLSNNLLGFYLLKFFGIYVSSYLVLFFFISPFLFINLTKLEYKKVLIFIIHLPFLIVVILFLIINPNKKEQSKIISLELVQILSPINKPDKILIEKEIIRKIKNSDAEYLVFGENNYPFLIQDFNLLNIVKFIKDKQKVIIGSSRLNNGKYFNSFLFLEKNNIQIFDKEILVPFGEFLPFRKYLKFMEEITGSTDFSSGNKKRLVRDNNINILPIICYEIIFNKIFKKINTNKIDILINITNDSWFGNRVGPYQHFYHSRMRALVSNKLLVRVSNNGISAVIDNNGKILKSSKLNIKTSFTQLVQLKSTTYHSLVHKLFIFYLILIILIYFTLIKYKSKYDK